MSISLLQIVILIIVIVLSTALAILFKRTRLGISFRAVSQEKTAAYMVRMPYKIRNFLYGTFWAGLAGALYAPYLMYIDPTIFTLDEGFSVLCMVLIGGLGTVIGPIAGSIVVIFLMESLRFLSNYRIAIYGLTIIFVMWVRPQGVFGAPITNMPKAISFHRHRRMKA